MDKDYRSPLSVSEAAHRLGVTEQVVRRALKNGALKGFKFGRAWHIDPDKVDQKRAGETSE